MMLVCGIGINWSISLNHGFDEFIRKKSIIYIANELKFSIGNISSKDSRDGQKAVS